jgi:hypothetical protein
MSTRDALIDALDAFEDVVVKRSTKGTATRMECDVANAKKHGFIDAFERLKRTISDEDADVLCVLTPPEVSEALTRAWEAVEVMTSGDERIDDEEETLRDVERAFGEVLHRVVVADRAWARESGRRVDVETASSHERAKGVLGMFRDLVWRRAFDFDDSNASSSANASSGEEIRSALSAYVDCYGDAFPLDTLITVGACVEASRMPEAIRNWIGKTLQAEAPRNDAGKSLSRILAEKAHEGLSDSLDEANWIELDARLRGWRVVNDVYALRSASDDERFGVAGDDFLAPLEFFLERYGNLVREACDERTASLLLHWCASYFCPALGWRRSWRADALRVARASSAADANASQWKFSPGGTVDKVIGVLESVILRRTVPPSDDWRSIIESIVEMAPARSRLEFLIFLSSRILSTGNEEEENALGINTDRRCALCAMYVTLMKDCALEIVKDLTNDDEDDTAAAHVAVATDAFVSLVETIPTRREHQPHAMANLLCAVYNALYTLTSTMRALEGARNLAIPKSARVDAARVRAAVATTTDAINGEKPTSSSVPWTELEFTLGSMNFAAERLLEIL